MPHGFVIVGIGEALFDLFPDGAQVLGGAPLNFAVHAHQIGSRFGGDAYPVSRLGNDQLGRRARAAVAALSVSDAFLQTDPVRRTGVVNVTLDEQRQPSYEIATGVAWDAIEFDDGLRRLAESCNAVCFGTLGQREAASRATIQSFVAAAKGAIRLFDVNLRQHFHSPDLIRHCCELASAIKLNEEELARLPEMLGIHGDPIEWLGQEFDLDQILLTRGALGTTLYTPGGVFSGEPVRYPMERGADSVGAGDACAAAAVVALVRGLEPPEIVRMANHAGAFVASRAGATPILPEF